MAFEYQTTIVLGAGASKSYGYPTGEELIDGIISSSGYLISDSPMWLPPGYFDCLLKLEQRLGFYDPISIDAFLSHYADEIDFIEAAKKAIVFELLKYSGNETFERNKKKENWYRFLWSAIVAGKTADELVSEDPKQAFRFNIITFNYDMSLERFLFSRVMSEFSFFSDEQKGAFLNKIKQHIYHVYGGMIDYKWLGGSIENGWRVPKHEDDGMHMANQLYRNIHLIDERNDRKEHYKELQEMLQQSHQIIFLGFGFDDTNIGRKVLNLTEAFRPRKSSVRDVNYWPIVKYTNYGNSVLIDRKINAKLNESIHVARAQSPIDPLPSSFEHEKIKSTKTVYDALEQDFSLNSL